MGSYGRNPAVLILMLVTPSAKLLDEKFWKNSWTNSSITSSRWFFLSSWNRFLAELWLGEKGSFTEESDGETAGVVIILAATVRYLALELIKVKWAPMTQVPEDRGGRIDFVDWTEKNGRRFSVEEGGGASGRFWLIRPTFIRRLWISGDTSAHCRWKIWISGGWRTKPPPPPPRSKWNGDECIDCGSRP